ncbi:hypothetical protein TWF730_001494 [Orbilia blumenaviensis]|uniref:Uncharacterized protein n=1 Tax=Orbilia blumenaviensis TaxID=1796055 RepID=A0AAV9UJU6_9PEZI
MVTESEPAIALSRSPTPTPKSNDTFDVRSDIESTTNTDISSDEDDGEDDEDDDEEDDGERTPYVPYFMNRAFFAELVKLINAITNASTDPSVGTDTTSLRKYYIRKLTELSNKPEYNIPLTHPPCPSITLKAVDHEGQDDDQRLSCPCCLEEDLPELKIVAEDVVGGVITYKILLENAVTWLYGPDQQEPLGLGQEAALGKVVEGLPAGEAGIVRWNFMTDEKDEATGDSAVMGLEICLYFVKPLVGGGRFKSDPKADNDEE